MIIYGTMTVDGNTTFSGKLSSGAADGSLHLTSTSSSEVTVNFNSSKNAYTNIYLNGTFVFSPILDGALGPKPATPGANGIFGTLHGAVDWSRRGKRRTQVHDAIARHELYCAGGGRHDQVRVALRPERRL
jgi:hypothetical protein